MDEIDEVEPVEEVEKSDFKSSDTLEHEIDLSGIKTTDNIAELEQRGNYLIGVTDQGIKFRQRIATDKILNKIDGKYVLQEMVTF